MTWKYILLAFVGGNAALAAVTAVGCGGSSNPTGTGGQTTSSSSHTLTHTTSSSTSTTTSGTGNLGAACTMDSDCGGGGLTCALPSATLPAFGGGPANGYCTKSCASDNDCGSSGICVTDANGANGTCVLSCTQTPLPSNTSPLSALNDPSKCNERGDNACQALDANMTQFGCIPVCGSDSACPSGLKCDPRSQMCVSTPTSGLPLGSGCTPPASGGTDPCSGVCVTFLNGSSPDAGTTSVCSEACVIGNSPTATSPTAWTDCGGVTKGLCAYLDPMTEGLGDQGFCTNACKKQDDCDNPNFFCFAINGLTGKSGITNGWCFGASPCPNGASDCTSFTGTSCVETAYGPQCLSAQFPLGSAAPDGGTTTTDAGSDAGAASDASTD